MARGTPRPTNLRGRFRACGAKAALRAAGGGSPVVFAPAGAKGRSGERPAQPASPLCALRAHGRNRSAPARSTRAPRMFHVKHSFASERIEAARSLFRSPRRSTVVEYAHAFCEGTYRRRRTLAFRAGRRGCMPRLRTARFRMPRTVCLAAHGGSARTTEPTAPFLIIPIDTSSTWVCPWCCDVSEPGAARPQPARSCAPLRGLLSSALFHVKHLYDHLMMRQGSPVKQAGATARTPTESERGRGSPHETIGNYQ